MVHQITSLRLLMLQQFRQLCNVHRDAAGLVAGEQVCSQAPARLVLQIDVGELLSRAVLQDEAGVGFLDGEAAAK